MKSAIGKTHMVFVFIHVFYYLTSTCLVLTRERKNADACTICKCKHLKDRTVYADCSDLGLSAVPKFSSNISRINFSRNRLNVFPESTKFPNKLIYLDMSENLINRFQFGSFKTLSILQELYLQSNLLYYNNATFRPGMFANLKCLKILNLKNNTREQTGERRYPDIALQDLQAMEEIHLDGLEDSPFGPGFKLLKKLTLFDLSGINGLCGFGIIKSNFFQNFPHIRVLDISGCRIIRIENGTFRNMARLQYLDISHNNDLTFAVAENVSYDLQFTNIKILKLNNIHRTFGIGTHLSKKDLFYLQNTSLEEIHVDNNRLELVEKGALKFAPRNLSFISVGDNKMTMGFYIFEIKDLKNLKTINATNQFNSHNSLDIFENDSPGTCDVYARSPCESPKGSQMRDMEEMLQETVSLKQNKLQLKLTIPLPPKLESIYFNFSLIRYEIPTLIFNAENQIKYLNYSGNILYKWKGPIGNLNKITILDLSNCFCSEVHSNFFSQLESLEELYISNNLLGFMIYKDDKGKIFQNLRNLRVLDLAQNRIQTLPPKFFRGLVNLTALDLSRNLIRTCRFDIHYMMHLKKFDLSNNQIFSLKKKIRNQLDDIARTHRVSVNVLGNNLLCNCEDLGFLKWTIEANRVYLIDLNKYLCLLPNGTKSNMKNLQEIIRLLDMQCSSKTGLIIAVLFGILLSLCVVIGGIVYRYRWKLRYLYYIAKNRYQGYQQIQTGENDGYEFDSFVSYAEEDGRFVYNDLLNNLELAEEDSLSLCIHGRDFMPGLSIAENITKAINSSRKSIFVLSRSFLRSEWCMYEFNMAKMESLYNRGGRNMMFIIFYETIPARELPMTLLELIESDSYIEYPNDTQGNVVFWKKIKEAIKTYY